MIFSPADTKRWQPRIDWPGYVFIAVLVSMFAGALYLAVRHDRKNAECEIVCTPMAYKVIDWTCFCATGLTPTRFHEQRRPDANHTH